MGTVGLEHTASGLNGAMSVTIQPTEGYGVHRAELRLRESPALPGFARREAQIAVGSYRIPAESLACVSLSGR